ncbi:YdgA family protein [Pseudomonas sp. BMS12]|uniref:YdgA family protein n=1 Tax=Pseudomonas sp. BMS12 TaxID=1796033 RepID=UPI00083A6F20|nr:YdgA family protein [Pseudomonas sp. BMS12]
MKKIAGIAVGTLVAVAAVGTAGAWYTGNQLPTVLDASIKQANDEMAKNLPAVGLSASIELLSLDRQFFSSEARYRVTFSGAFDGEQVQDFELIVADHIEHGPFPLSRLKAVKLMPVLATSNYVLEQNPQLEKWFAATAGTSPLTGQVSLGYDNSLSGTLQIKPLETAVDEHTAVSFSGLDIDFDSTAQAKAINAQGSMGNLRIKSRLESSDAPLTIEIKGMTLNSQTEKGASDFYLGSNEVRLQAIEVLVGDDMPIVLKDVVQRDETAEADGKLSARYGYDVGMVSFQGHDLGSSQMLWSMKNLDGSALQSLVALYGDLMQSDWQYQKTSSETGMPELSEAQQAQLMVDLEKLLAGNPGIALEKLAFKTANGESSLSLALDLGKPESFELPPPLLAKQLITQLDAKLVVSKAMIGDVIGLQAAIAGETDQDAIAQQASMMTEMASGMAQASELARVDGDNIVTSLHYADDKVDFNGKQMTVEEFVAMAFATGAGLGGMGGASMDDEMPDMSELEGLETDEDAEAVELQ